MSAMSPGPTFPLPHHFPVVICSPHNPPYEQLLVGLGWVPCCSAVVFCPPLLTPAAVANCTCHPPHEQLLIGMGVGTVALGVIVVVLPCCSCCCCSTHNPPCEQLLVRLGVGDVVLFILLPHCIPGLFPALNKSLTSCFDREEGLGMCHGSLL